MRLRAAADKLEHYSRKEGLTAVDEMVAAIKAEFAQAATELKRLIGNG